MKAPINADSVIASAADVTEQDMGDEVLLYDSSRENVHILNSTAQKIWKLCDGRHTVGQICEVFYREYPHIPNSEISDDIAGILTELQAKSLISVA